MDQKKGYIEDSTNKMWDQNHQRLVNGYGQIPHNAGDENSPNWHSYDGEQPSPSPSPTPAPTPVSDWGAYRKQFPGGKIPSGTKVRGVDPQDGKIKDFVMP
jgi:hypothetical protein